MKISAVSTVIVNTLELDKMLCPISTKVSLKGTASNRSLLINLAQIELKTFCQDILYLGYPELGMK